LFYSEGDQPFKIKHFLNLHAFIINLFVYHIIYFPKGKEHSKIDLLLLSYFLAFRQSLN